MRHRTDTEREADRRTISDLYLQGWNQTDIAHHLGIDQSTVSRDIKTLKGEWRKQRNGLVDEFEAKYRLMYKEAYAAWLKSKEDAVTETQEAVEREAGSVERQRLKVSTRREGQSGNPALLAQALAALKAMREMFGVDAPTKATNFNYDLSKATDEQLQRIAAGDDPATVLASTQSSG